MNTSTSAEILAKVKELEESITEGEKIEEAQKALSLEHTKFLTEKGTAETKYTEDKGKVDAIKTNISRLQNEIETYKEKISTNATAISTALEGTLPWDNDWQLNPNDFIEELNAKVAAHNTDEQALQKINEGIKTTEPVIKNICEHKENHF